VCVRAMYRVRMYCVCLICWYVSQLWMYSTQYFPAAWRFTLSHDTSSRYLVRRMEFSEFEATPIELVVGVFGWFESHPRYLRRLREKHQVCF